MEHTRKIFNCPLCKGRYYYVRALAAPPVRVRCPHCGSILMTHWDDVQLLIRGIIPIPAPNRKVPVGLISGFLIGLAIGGTPAGIIGALFGLAAGSKAESARKAQIV